jgi:hypothetical protein
MNQKLLTAIHSFLALTGKGEHATEHLYSCFCCGGKEAAKIAFDYDRQSFEEEQVTEFENDFADWLQRFKGTKLNELPVLSSNFHNTLDEYYKNHPDYNYCIRNESQPADWAELGAIIIFRALRAHMSEQYTNLELDSYEAGIADTLKIKA